MTSVNDAIEKIKAGTNLRSPVKFPLNATSGLVLAQDVFANCSVPNFDQAAMDGYALRFDALEKTKEFYVAQEIAAGDRGDIATPVDHMVRIFTGAVMPAGLDTVVMQEKVELQNDRIVVLDKELKKGSNVRLKGAEINKGDLALKKNSLLTPAAIGFLASVGTNELLAYPKPNVHIIVTGKELVRSAETLQPGQVYESNSHLLLSALNQLHIFDITVDFIGDDLDETVKSISKALDKADLILLTGGVSAGDYDFVVKAAETCEVEQLFHKVKQRPGKPLYAGIKNDKIIFGLPGNPASVLTCFYNYVVTAIECMTGQKDLVPRRWLPLESAYSKKVPLTQFLKASFSDEKVLPLPAQESFRLSSFSSANCLIVLPEEKMDFVKGEPVETLILPYL